MLKMKNLYPYIVLILGFVIIGVTQNNNLKNKIKYCHIDSVTTVSRNGLTPEVDYKYHTDCNQSFYSKRTYNIGDSIISTEILIKK